MIRNHLKIAWRNITRNKAISIINIGGLAIGMAVAIQIGLWMIDEVSFNKNFDHYSRIAKVIQNVTNNGEVQTWTSVPYPLAEEIRKNYGSDFSQVVMEASPGDHIVSRDEKKLTMQGGFFEKGATEMLSLKMLRGKREFTDPSSILISESASKAFFGTEEALNKILKIDNQLTVKISGVYADLPKNSSFAGLNFMSTWDLYYSQSDWVKTMSDPWRPNAFDLYVVLNEQADIQKVSAKIKDAKLNKVSAQLAKKKPALFLQPMSEWHLYSEYKNGVNTGGGIQYVRMFCIIGVFVLLLACINFMNLSTAKSEKRAKEVGIRKTIGSLRTQLIIQFFSESLLTVFLSSIISILIVQFTLPVFNQIADKQMFIPWSNPFFWVTGIGFVLFTGLIAGTYPSFYLSSFQPIKVLKGSFKSGRWASVPRKMLVVTQFTVSIILIIGTMIVYRQIQFAKNRPVGYTRNGLITTPLIASALHEHFNAFKEELLLSGAVQGVTVSGSPPTGIWNSTSGFSWKGKDPNLSTDFGVVSTAFDYGKTIGWKIKEGRDFSRDFPTDSSAVILNEAAVQYMGLKNPVGETVTWWDQSLKIIGVSNNMVMRSPYDEARPVIFTLSTDVNIAIIRIRPELAPQQALNKIAPIVKKFNPEQPFDFKFVDDDYATKFIAEEQIGKLSAIFAALAIFISCLGLFGLSSYVAEQRSREIGLRKVLGASVWNVWKLLLQDFVLLILMACIISIPLAGFASHHWLEQYEYRTGISWWIFAAAAIGALCITLATVSYQALKAAFSNPVKTLRAE